MNVSLKEREKSKKELLNKSFKLKKELEKQDLVFQLRKKILHLRINKGLSQTELAERAGTKQTVISRIENGTCEPQLKTIQNIAAALDKNIKIEFTN
jgi:ribosome-binding protein aMBF1 (putative translation factor)